MDEPWPRTGQRVAVTLEQETQQLVAVVDDVRAPSQLHLREPVREDGHPLAPVELGTPVTLTWTTGSGHHVLRSHLVALPQTRVPLWKLEPLCAPEVLQRREFVRVPDMLLVQLRRGASRWSARLCDLSEGGARCVLLDANDVAEGDHLQVALTVDDAVLELRCVVQGVAVLDEQRTTARLRFQPARAEADVLRRRVLDLQRRARAAGLR